MNYDIKNKKRSMRYKVIVILMVSVLLGNYITAVPASAKKKYVGMEIGFKYSHTISSFFTNRKKNPIVVYIDDLSIEKLFVNEERCYRVTLKEGKHVFKVKRGNEVKKRKFKVKEEYDGFMRGPVFIYEYSPFTECGHLGKYGYDNNSYVAREDYKNLGKIR